MRLLSSSLVQSVVFLMASSSLAPFAVASGSSDSSSPCVAHSPISGLYYDLNAISLTPPEMKDGKKVHKTDRDESWQAKGHDYGANFTINICRPAIEDVRDVEGVEKSRWMNVSAYYEKGGKVYSIGQQASDPFFRGRKLILNYTDGSPCPSTGSSKYSDSRTKSTIMSFLCDRDAHASQTAASFVGTMDECSYFFEVRSSVACGGMAHGSVGEGLGPGGVFGVICLIAIAAYFLGGCAYQRTVMHQRGWRQCPNFSLWAGIVDFFKDMAIILLSSVAHLFNCRRPSFGSGSGSGAAYSSVNSSADGHRRGSIRARGGSRDVDEENRLIDQLDEEWDG